VRSVGISYMYGGFWVPNKSHATGSGNEFRVGPNVMIIGLDQKIMQTLNHDGSNGEPYVNHLAGRPELYLVIPIREWDDAQEVSVVGAAASLTADRRCSAPAGPGIATYLTPTSW
jgi:hypothetical protein